jgi:UDP-N-acetylglucosamine--N-acetylmuramyl-(pentapeptide) pyrophosphoryl-undecaprenol N-acetylglucosamine transferase
VGLRALPGNILRLVRGYFAARRILKAFKPQVLLFTGGYIAVPMALANRSVPSLLYVPDIEPGLALQVLAQFASTIALTTETSKTHFPKRKHTVVTGYPTRPELGAWNRERGCSHLALDPRRKVLLVTGGSKGARSINQALIAVLPELLKMTQVVHITGQTGWAEVEQAALALPAEQRAAYHAMPYLHEMGAALAAADLVVSRAGASSLGEYPLFGLPAVLVPYPYAWRYQKTNAGYLVQREAAVLLEDADLTSQLYATVQSLLNDENRLNKMRRAMHAMARPQAATDLANLVRQMAQGGHS